MVECLPLSVILEKFFFIDTYRRFLEGVACTCIYSSRYSVMNVCIFLLSLLLNPVPDTNLSPIIIMNALVA